MPGKNTDRGSSRRSFVRTSAAAVAGLGTLPASGARRLETLALDGGPAAVKIPAAKHTAVTRWPRYGDKEKQAVGELLDTNKYYQELPRLEALWKEYTGAPFVKTHMNCTSALTSMFFAIDLPPGSEVMVPSYTFFATITPMRLFGYVPIFVDIDPKTACFDLEDAKKKLTSRTKAMVVMHAWGMPCEMDHIEQFAKEKGLMLLEDAAQAHGASMQGKMVGNWGAVGTFSFQASKVLPSVEGGMANYKTRELYERAAAYGHYKDPTLFPEDSEYRRYEGTGFGQKFRMHPFAAAVVRTQLEGLDELNAQVKRRLRKLNDRITQLGGLEEPRCRPDQNRVYYHANMLLLDEAKAGFSRDALVKALKAEGVRASVWDYPLQHKFSIYSEPKWWHHPPVIPDVLPGCEQVNKTHIFVALHYEDHPELAEQYATAFEKVWASHEKLAKL